MGLERRHRRDASAMKAPMCHSDARAMRFVSNGVPSVLAAMLVLGGASRSLASEPLYLSPGSLLADRPGQNLFVACTTANRVLVVNLADRQVTRTFPMPGSPSGLALSAHGRGTAAERYRPGITDRRGCHLAGSRRLRFGGGCSRGDALPSGRRGPERHGGQLPSSRAGGRRAVAPATLPLRLPRGTRRTTGQTPEQRHGC